MPVDVWENIQAFYTMCSYASSIKGACITCIIFGGGVLICKSFHVCRYLVDTLASKKHYGERLASLYNSHLQLFFLKAGLSAIVVRKTARRIHLIGLFYALILSVHCLHTFIAISALGLLVITDFPRFVIFTFKTATYQEVGTNIRKAFQAESWIKHLLSIQLFLLNYIKVSTELEMWRNPSSL